ncbi:hypothetical protein M3G03_11160 [Aestuariimicrobium sp. p3-SID1156]|uniref:hypothetical protein n=1 Tax=Aestuariimicrobium sp. p3-SID1156 TaxID=2916038 RepID=UPI00223AED1E|nr:hypothetical protein [Aestuariimicrobium sp. p3-SID1156]MCT1460086.1 hypothetical protein [Aestuariimicrobium sp. p3-SID1156]
MIVLLGIAVGIGVAVGLGSEGAGLLGGVLGLVIFIGSCEAANELQSKKKTGEAA